MELCWYWTLPLAQTIWYWYDTTTKSNLLKAEGVENALALKSHQNTSQEGLITFFPKKNSCIPNPKLSVVQKQIKRAMHLLRLEWSGTVPVQENGRKPSWAVFTLASSVYLLQCIAPVSIPLRYTPSEKGEGLWNHLSVWNSKTDVELETQNVGWEMWRGCYKDNSYSISFQSFSPAPKHQFCILNLPTTTGYRPVF